ncbi:helix-turn-helix transcriptional regulator [Parasphingorhabdus sp.]|uniref:helix-turn-helix transcriptional regulator n=2 Tax=Parasphingorhabdus sp. TaxID=2709688 RepID=UPI00326770E8
MGMSIILSEEHDLIAALHRGTLGAPPWEDFLEQLRRRTAADYASLFFQGEHDWLQSVRIPALNRTSDAINEIHQWDSGDTKTLPHNTMRLNRVYSLDELIDSNNPLQNRFKALFVQDENIRFARNMRVAEPNGGQIWISLGREKSDFSASDGALLGSLSNHLAIAAGTHSELERQRLKAGISADAIMRLNFGWLLLDASGRIIDMSEQAEVLVQEAQTLRKSPDGRLITERSDAQGILHKFLKMRQAGENAVRTVHLSDEPWLDMLLTNPPADLPGALQPVAIAFVHGERSSSVDRSQHLANLFGLSLQEARLAVHISRGVTIREAAMLLGLTLETTRLYSKRIYAKTGTRGQADLVRLILASIVALA